jgi:hypothetical protein
MVDTTQLTLADPSDLAEALGFALCSSGRKRAGRGDELMARITAERLIEHLRLSGFVVMKQPPMPPRG